MKNVKNSVKNAIMRLKECVDADEPNFIESFDGIDYNMWTKGAYVNDEEKDILYEHIDLVLDCFSEENDCIDYDFTKELDGESEKWYITLIFVREPNELKPFE